MSGEPVQQLGEVFAGEFPLERSSDFFVIAFKRVEVFGDFVESGEIVRGENLLLNYGEIDFDLIEPASMVWGMNQDGVGPLFFEAIDRCLPSVDGSIIDDPKDSAGAAIGLSLHDVTNESVKGDNRSVWHTTAEDFRPMNIPCGDVGPGAFSEVLVFNSHRPSRCRHCGGVFATPTLDTGFLISTDDEVIIGKGFATPTSFVEIQNGFCSFREVRVSWKHPASMGPGLDGILAQPPPEGCLPNARRDSTLDDFSLKVRRAQA